MIEPIEISQLAKIITGKTPPTKIKEYFIGEYPFITPSDIPTFQEKILPYTERSLSELGKKYQKQLLIPKGSVCYVAIGSTIGKMCQTNTDSFTNQQLHSLIPYSDKIDCDYLFYLLRTITPYIQLIGDGKGSGKPIINKTEFSKVKVYLAHKRNEQQVISSIISAYDQLIEINNHRIRLLEETTRELYKEWFVRMRFPGYNNLKFVKGVPEKVGEIKYFKDFVKLNRGFDLPEDKIREGQYPVVASTTIKAYHSQFKVKAPIITTGRSGSLGTVLFVNEDGWPLNTSLYVKDFKGNEPLYVYYTLKVIDFESYNSGAGVPTLNQNHLHKLKMWIADEVLQLKFKLMAEPMFQQVEILNQQNVQLRQIRDRLLPRLISGKLEVKQNINKIIPNIVN